MLYYYSASSKNGWKQNKTKTKGKKYPGRVGYGDKLGKSFSLDTQIGVCVLCNDVHLLIIATTTHTRKRFYDFCTRFVRSAILG